MELLKALLSLQLPLGHYAVFGSGPLIVRGIIDATNDLDVITRGRLGSTPASSATRSSLKNTAWTSFVHCFDDAITIGRSWATANSISTS